MKLDYLLGVISILSMMSFAYENQAQEIVEQFEIDNRTIIGIAWSPNGDFLAASDVNEILVIDVDTQELINSIPTSSPSIAWNMESSQIATYDLSQNAILVFDAQNAELLYSLEGSNQIKETSNFMFVREVVWSECGLFSVNGSIDLFLWGESEYLKDTLILSGHEDVVSNVIITEDCKYIITNAVDQTVKLWRMSSGENTLSLNSRRSIAIRGDSITYISPENNISEYTLSQVNDSQILYELGSDEQVSSLNWSHDNDILIYTTSHEVKILVPPSDAPITVHISSDYLDEVALHPSKPLMIVVDSSGTMSLLNLEPILIGN